MKVLQLTQFKMAYISLFRIQHIHIYKKTCLENCEIYIKNEKALFKNNKAI